METQTIDHRFVRIETQDGTLDGNLGIPEGSQGIVVFVHGSGSSRHSPRNQYVAEVLQETGLATLLFDLLTDEEEELDIQTRELRFDINLLARRAIGAIDWLLEQPYAKGWNLGTFGSSTGAAAALIAAAERPEQVHAVVSRGGRPDLAEGWLDKVEAPTLLIVGELDVPVIGLNERALDQMKPEPEKKITIVPGATHLFEEEGALEMVARLASDWFESHLDAERQESG
jgi:putative phosphoribosyl transferase